MPSTPPSRREFLVSSAQLLGGGWIALSLPALAALSACARDAAERGEPLETLDAAEGRAMRAFAAQILPSDDLPGAEEAGVVYFVDRALGGPFAGMRGLVGAGLADLDERARGLGADEFAALPPERQMETMRQVEDTPFFGATRMLVLAGMFSDPTHGGNRDGAGWNLLGMEHRGSFQPPFGYYDAQQAGGAA